MFKEEGDIINEFFYKYFIEPVEKNSGYNVVNTITYGIILVIISYFIFKALRKRIKFDFYLFLAGFPFLIFATFLRVLTDAGIYPKSFFTVTPGIILWIVGVMLLVALISKLIEKKYGIEYWKLCSLVGSILSIFQIPFLKFENWLGIFLILIHLAISISPFLIIIFLSRKYNSLRIFCDKLNFLMILAHMFDASATSVSINYFGYWEMHVFPGTLINLFGNAYVMYLLKLIVIIPIIFVLEKYCDDIQLKNFIKLIFIAFGFATSIRDSLRLLMGV